MFLGVVIGSLIQRRLLVFSLMFRLAAQVAVLVFQFLELAFYRGVLFLLFR